MRLTLIMLLLLAIVAWFVPQQAEDVDGQCRALDSLVLREQVVQTPADRQDAAQAAAVVRRVAQYAREQHAGLPPGLACFLVYWEMWPTAELGPFQADPA